MDDLNDAQQQEVIEIKKPRKSATVPLIENVEADIN